MAGNKSFLWNQGSIDNQSITAKEQQDTILEQKTSSFLYPDCEERGKSLAENDDGIIYREKIAVSVLKDVPALSKEVDTEFVHAASKAIDNKFLQVKPQSKYLRSSMAHEISVQEFKEKFEELSRLLGEDNSFSRVRTSKLVKQNADCTVLELEGKEDQGNKTHSHNKSSQSGASFKTESLGHIKKNKSFLAKYGDLLHPKIYVNDSNTHQSTGDRSETMSNVDFCNATLLPQSPLLYLPSLSPSSISCSSSTSSLTDSPPQSATYYDTPPTPPPLSTLPVRPKSSSSHGRFSMLALLNENDHIYEELDRYAKNPLYEICNKIPQDVTDEDQDGYSKEPLYQIYNRNTEEHARKLINKLVEGKSEAPIPETLNETSPCLLEGQHRTLWCQIPEVINSGVLDSISPKARQLQEAKYEILTSEASYMNSLNILKNHFIVNLETCRDAELTEENRRLLFSDIDPVRETSEKFLLELQSCRKENMFLRGICGIVHDAAKKDFKVYTNYCSSLKRRENVLTRLTSLEQSHFSQLLNKLEADPICQALPMQTFFLVPMQRITKLQLLMDSVLNRMENDDEEYESCKEALEALKQVVHECNEEVRSVERMEELIQINSQMEFGKCIKPIDLLSNSRYLVKKGQVTEIRFNNKDYLMKSLYIFLFNDLLLLAKRRMKYENENT